MSVYGEIVKGLLKDDDFKKWLKSVSKEFVKFFRSSKRERKLAALDGLSLAIKDVSYPGPAATYGRLNLVRILLVSIVSSVELFGKGIVLSKFYMRERFLYLPRIASPRGIIGEYQFPPPGIPRDLRTFGFKVHSAYEEYKMYRFYVLEPISGDKMPSDAFDRFRSEIDRFHESPTSEGELAFMMEQCSDIGIKAKRVHLICYFSKNGIIALSDDEFISDDKETDIHLYFGDIQSTRDSISQEWRDYMN